MNTDESKIEGIPQGAFMGDDIRADLAALQKQKDDAEKAAEEAAAREAEASDSSEEDEDSGPMIVR